MENKDKEPLTPIAVTNWRDIRRVFGIKQKNRRGHIYVIGKTGTGKSTLMARMMIDDMQQGYGIGVVDPHGDLAETILQHVPKERVNDVIYFNAADFDYPIPFNPLEQVPNQERHLVVSGLLSVFKKMWHDFWGPRLEHILRHALFTLLEVPGSTLLDVPRLLTDAEFRKMVLMGVNDPHVRAFWTREFDKYSAWLRSEATSPILNKVGQFLTAPPLRNIVGQPHDSFRMREVMDEGKILIVNLSKGKIGEDNSSLLGAMIVTELQLAAISRAHLPEHARKAFYLYVDEFHNFLTLSFADMLSESRKYGLNLILAHQYLDQMHEKVRLAVFGNVGTIISFRVGAEDAKCLAREFHPTFDETDFVNLPNYQIYLRLMVDGATSEPFSGTTMALGHSGGDQGSRCVEASRANYARLRSNVEIQVLERCATLANKKKRLPLGLL